MRRIAMAALALAWAAQSSFGQSAQSPPPLDRAEILGRLAAGYSPSYIAYLVETRGVSFSVTATFLDQVSRAGGRGVLADNLPHATSSDAGISPDGQDVPFDHLGKCAELIRAGDLEDGRPECRASIGENPNSPWPVRATLSALELASSESRQDFREPDPAMEKEATDLQQKLARWPAPRMLRPRDAFLAGSPLSPEVLESTETNSAWGGRDGLDSFFYATPGDDQDSPEANGEPNAASSQMLDQIRDQLLQAVQSAPDLASSHLALGSFYAEQLHDFDKARAEELEAIRLEPDAERGHVALALLYRSRKDFAGSVAELREVVRIAPQGVGEHLALAGMLEKAGRDADAIAEFQAVIARRPEESVASDRLVGLYVKQKDLESAIKELRRSLNVSKAAYGDETKFVDARWDDEKRLAELLGENRDLEGAAEVYEFILRFRPDDGGLHNDYGNVLMAQGHCDQAIGEYNQALRLEPKMPEPHHNTALCLARGNDLNGAINEFRAALQLDPNSPHSQAFLGMALVQKGDFKGAEDDFRDLIEKHPGDSEPHVDFALALSTMKRDADAIPELKKALELQPDSPTAENNLAWIYATSDDHKLRNAGEALRLAQLAVQTSPVANPAFIDTLAEAQLLNGDATEALATEEKALALAPDSPELKKRVEHFRDAATKSSSSSPEAGMASPAAPTPAR